MGHNAPFQYSLPFTDAPIPDFEEAVRRLTNYLRKDISPFEFEAVSGQAISHQFSLTDFTVTGRGADGGIDGFAIDTFGNPVYWQSKQTSNAATRPTLQKFAGALIGQRAVRGVFVSASGFTRAALNFCRSLQAPRIDLVSLPELAQSLLLCDDSFQRRFMRND